MPLHRQVHPIWPHDLAFMFPAQSEVHVRTMMAPIIASFGGHISAVEAIPPTAFREHFHRPPTSTPIHPEVPSRLRFCHISFPTPLTRQNTNLRSPPFQLANFRRIMTPPQLRTHPPPALVSEKRLGPILFDWCVSFDLISTFSMLNSVA